MADRSTRQKRYTQEFRLQAAKLIVEGGTTYHQASKQLGVSDWALRCWVKDFHGGGTGCAGAIVRNKANFPRPH